MQLIQEVRYQRTVYSRSGRHVWLMKFRNREMKLLMVRHASSLLKAASRIQPFSFLAWFEILQAFQDLNALMVKVGINDSSLTTTLL